MVVNWSSAWGMPGAGWSSLNQNSHAFLLLNSLERFCFLLLGLGCQITYSDKKIHYFSDLLVWQIQNSLLGWMHLLLSFSVFIWSPSLMWSSTKWSTELTPQDWKLRSSSDQSWSLFYNKASLCPPNVKNSFSRYFSFVLLQGRFR